MVDEKHEISYVTHHHHHIIIYHLPVDWWVFLLVFEFSTIISLFTLFLFVLFA